MTKDQFVAALIAKGVPYNQAWGMAANVEAESGFDPGAIGDNGTSGGLFQHHGPRFYAMQQAVGPNWANDPMGQINFALSEPDTGPYLAASYQNPAEASMAFTREWERPANADQKAVERLKHLPNGEQYMDNMMGDFLSVLGISPASASGATPPFFPEQQGQQAQPPEMPSPRNEWLSNAFRDPLFQFGVGILSNPSGATGSTFTSIGKGMQHASQTLEDQRARDLYEMQVRVSQRNAMGRNVPNPQDYANARGQASAWYNPATGETKVAFQDRMLGGVMIDAATGQPVNLTGWMPAKNMPQSTAGGVSSTVAKIDLGDHSPEARQKYTEAMARGDQQAAYQALDFANATSGGGGAGGDSDVAGHAAMIGQLNSLVAEMEKSPEQMNSLGTLGRIGATASAITSMLDKFTGGNMNEGVRSFFGGEDPAVVQSKLRASTIPIAKLLVDPKGPLAQNEQDQARRLLTTLEGEIQSPEQALSILKQTLALANLYLAKKGYQGAAAGGGALQTGMQAPPQAGAWSPPAGVAVRKVK